MRTSWPEAGLVDEGLVNSSIYLMDTAHDFRSRMKNFTQAKAKGGKGKDAPAAPPKEITKATVYVAKTFPLWQQIILDTLKTMYAENGNQFPADNKAILTQLQPREELKKYMKKVMPFVAFVKVIFYILFFLFFEGFLFISQFYFKEQAAKKGASALNSAIDFDEYETLRINQKYLQETLKVSFVLLKIFKIN